MWEHGTWALTAEVPVKERCQWAQAPASSHTQKRAAFLNLECMEMTLVVAQLCPTLCHPVDCSPPGSSIRGILWASILEWAAIPFSGIFWNQWPNLGLPTCRQILYYLSPQGYMVFFNLQKLPAFRLPAFLMQSICMTWFLPSPSSSEQFSQGCLRYYLPGLKS